MSKNCNLNLRLSQKKTKSQLSLQRKEYETIVKRHLTFIDKVIAEKEDLSQKSILLTEQVAELEKQYQKKVLDE
jgi:hypothetical protein